jgi:hypothetical protein
MLDSRDMRADIIGGIAVLGALAVVAWLALRSEPTRMEPGTVMDAAGSRARASTTAPKLTTADQALMSRVPLVYARDHRACRAH